MEEAPESRGVKRPSEDDGPEFDLSEDDAGENGAQPAPDSAAQPPAVPAAADEDDESAGSDAQEEEEIFNPRPASDDEGEELFGEEMIRDYESDSELDQYDPDVLDEAQYAPMTFEQRRAAEAEIRRRARRLRKRRRVEGRDQPRSRIPTALQQYSSDEESSDDMVPLMRRRGEPDMLRGIRGLETYETEVALTPESVKGPLREWLAIEATERAIRRHFRNFLASYRDEHGHQIYQERIQSMCLQNRSSLEVNYHDLTTWDQNLAVWVVTAPSQLLRMFDEVAYQAVLEMFPDYEKIRSEVHVRISQLPVSDSLRDIRQSFLNGLLKVSGVVTRRTNVFPQLRQVRYDCPRCGFIMGPYNLDRGQEPTIGACPQCHTPPPFPINTELTLYRNYQKITLQESPGSVPPGRIPRSKEVILLGDLIDSARPGEEIEVTGIYRNNFDSSLNLQNGFPVFATVIEANFVSKTEDLYASFRLTEEDERIIRELGKDEHIGERIIQSIAPSIFGHDDIKTALALALFGGESKDIDQKHRIRGDINVLLLGDPGTAKSQFLKYVEKTAHRAVYATGQGASAVGLTAAVHKDPVTREWVLEGGALVLADHGVCLIDEFDKMNDQDRTSIHEAMEQQSISISKAGIVTSLQARCSVIAAANPVKGRYDPTVAFAQNIELTDAILSRFDILCVVRDVVDPVADEQLAFNVVRSHMRSHPAYQKPADAVPTPEQKYRIPQDILRKYLVYAKRNVHPKLSHMPREKIMSLYAEMRKESKTGGGVPITVRHLESMFRIAEAHAKMHLREYVRDEDVDMAIRVALDSFIMSQKTAVARTMYKKFRKYVTYKKDFHELLFYLLQTLLRETVHYHQVRYGREPTRVEIPMDDFETRAKEYDIHDVSGFYLAPLFSQNGFTLERQRRQIVKVFTSAS